MLTLQEIFDISSKGIIDQGGYAWADGACVYRAPDGNKCAAGHLIPDEKYDPAMEGGALLNRPEVVEAIGLKHDTTELDLLRELQIAHDNSSGYEGFMSDWLRRVRSVGEKYGLSTAVLDEVTA